MIPAAPSTRRKRLIWDRFVLGGLERLTEHIMSGAEICDEDEADMIDLSRRATAFINALQARIKAAGQVIEDDQ